MIHSSPLLGDLPRGGVASILDLDDAFDDANDTLQWLRNDSPWSKTTCKVAKMTVCPDEVFKTLRGFFRDTVRAVIDGTDEPFGLSVTAFVEYMPIHVLAFPTHAGGTDIGSTLTFRPTSKSDPVRFGQLWGKARDYLVARRMMVTDMPTNAMRRIGGAMPTACTLLEDDFFDELEEDWNTCVKSALADAASGKPQITEVALQTLAAWGVRQPDARRPMAEAFAAQPALVANMLKAPVEMLYPFAVALRYASLAADGLLEDLKDIINAKIGCGLPHIVEVELQEALENLLVVDDALPSEPGFSRDHSEESSKGDLRGRSKTTEYEETSLSTRISDRMRRIGGGSSPMEMRWARSSFFPTTGSLPLMF